MQPFTTITLLTFGVCWLKSYLCTKICSGNQYTVVDANGNFLKCQSCDKCHEGYGLDPKCGSIVQSPVKNVDCKECASGTFSNKYDSSSCNQCQRCAEHEVVTSHCSSQSDTICSGTCDKGYYFAKDASHACHECSYCCFNGRDQEQPECARQSLKARNQHCSRREDKNCGPKQSKTTGNRNKQGDDKLVKPLAITFGLLVGVAVVAVFILIIRKRRSRSNEEQSREQEPEHVTPMIEVVTDAKDSTATSQENGNVINQDASKLLTSHPTGQALPRPCVSNLNPGFVPSNPGTPNVSPHHTDDELDGEPDAAKNRPRHPKRQKSRDSQTSRGQIKIVQQPKSQNQKEGLKVEFTCNCEVQEKFQVWYQWLKDGKELQGQNTSRLVIDSSQMRDFGCYRCQVTCVGDESQKITSDPAVLEVSPCDGMRLKFLGEVDFDTRDGIADRLENIGHGLGNWRQIASKYGMEEHQIGGLANSQQRPGQEVMKFLLASNPDLTVYSFCKTLKEANLKRFDIVKVLEGHLTVKKESK